MPLRSLRLVVRNRRPANVIQWREIFGAPAIDLSADRRSTLERARDHSQVLVASIKSMRAGLASRGMTGGCTGIERALMDCCCRATSKCFSILSPNELWKILSAGDTLVLMDGALSFHVSLWPVVLDALVAGCLRAYANSAKAFVGEAEFLGGSRP